MKNGGTDAAWSAALAHQGLDYLDEPNPEIADMYNRVGNPHTRAFDQRALVADMIEKLYGTRSFNPFVHAAMASHENIQ